MTVLHPQWAWELTGGSGVLDRPVSPAFTTRYDAEEWLGAQWRVLRDRGVRSVLLRNAGSPVAPTYDLTAVPEQMTVRPRD